MQHLHIHASEYYASLVLVPKIIVGKNLDNSRTVSFADNGEGVDPEYATEIFRVFKRLHPRAKHPGTGMGLSICQKIVERYGGKIWVEPNRGGGRSLSSRLQNDLVQPPLFGSDSNPNDAMA